MFVKKWYLSERICECQSVAHSCARSRIEYESSRRARHVPGDAVEASDGSALVAPEIAQDFVDRIAKKGRHIAQGARTEDAVAVGHYMAFGMIESLAHD